MIWQEALRAFKKGEFVMVMDSDDREDMPEIPFAQLWKRKRMLDPQLGWPRVFRMNAI